MYLWARIGVVTPDFDGADPKQWSYRDLVFLRLLAWLRGNGMERSHAAEEVASVRRRLTRGELPGPLLRGDKRVLLAPGESVDPVTGIAPLSVDSLVATFDLTEPIEGVGRVWGPNLVRPSLHTYISPWVMGGEPVITDTRIPSSSIWALRTQRQLSAASIVGLYPTLTTEEVEDAIALEQRIRAADLERTG